MVGPVLFPPERPNPAARGLVTPFLGVGSLQEGLYLVSGLTALAFRAVTSTWNGIFTLAPRVGSHIRTPVCFIRMTEPLPHLKSVKTCNAPSPQEVDLSSCGSFSWNCSLTNPASRSSAGLGTDGSLSLLTPMRYGRGLWARNPVASLWIHTCSSLGTGKGSQYKGGTLEVPAWLR